MYVDGKILIKALCNRLEQQNKLCTDNQICILLRSLDHQEMDQLLKFGKNDSWERERINPESS